MQIVRICGVWIALTAIAIAAAPAFAGVRAYKATSPWNTPITANPKINPNSAALISRLGESFGTNVASYTMPVYLVTSSTPLKTVSLSGTFSLVTGDSVCNRTGSASVRVPIPDEAVAAAGTDAQIILLNEATGEEWGFWQAAKQPDGSWVAVNGYKYNIQWDGIPPVTPHAFMSRGARVPYLTGLVRPWEIIQGRVEHAIAFAYQSPASTFVCPATGSDGSSGSTDMPEGTRIQLDPTLNVDDPALGLSRTGKILARAMQQFGLILIDGGGHPKVYGEYQVTAAWNTTNSSALDYWTSTLVRNIPHTRFRVLVTSPTTCLPEASGSQDVIRPAVTNITSP